MTPEELLAAWHIQQTAFIEFREQRVKAMLEMLAAAHPEDRPLRVLDLGCGPGSLCDAVADRFPDAEVVGLDRDPILLRLGRETNRHGERMRLLDLDLADPGWIHEVGRERFDAVVSATALHWLSPDKLAGLYVALPQVLNPGAAFYKARLMRRMGADQPSSAWGSRHNNQQDGTRPGLRAMLVICEECAQKYKVDERQMRGDRARFTCQKCGHPVIVRREDAAPGRPHGESRIPIVETSY